MMASVIRLVLLAGLLAVPAAHGIGLLLGSPGSAVVQSAPPPDTTPDSFSFTDQTNVALSSTITSAAVTITGIDTSISCSATGGTIDVAADADFQSSRNVTNNQQIRARNTSSGSFSTAVNTAVDCGGVSDTFTSTTLAADTTPNSFSFTDLTNQALSSTMTSAAITVAGINSASTITVTGGTYDINASGSFTGSSGSVNNGDTVRARHTSSGSNSTATNTVVTIGGVSDTFTSTTVASGGLTHGASYGISGTGFGSKSSNTIIWDDASHGQALSARWSGWWPNASTAAYNLDYRTPAEVGRGVALPHSNITNYISGAHYNDGEAIGPASSYNVALWRTFTRPSFPYYSYWHWYERTDPNWTYDTGSDNNFKYWGLGTGASIYEDSPNNWYIAANACAPGCGDMASSGQTTMSAITNDDASGGGTSYVGFATGVLGYGFASPQAGWVRREVLIRWDNASGGTGDIRFWTNNTSGTLDTAGGYTDDYSGTTRSEGPGGYARDYPDADNWRYFADVMYDRGTNPGRFYLTNNATYSSATIREPQPWTSWSDTSVTITVNKGTLSSGTAHLHYRNEAGTPQYIGSVTLN